MKTRLFKARDMIHKLKHMREGSKQFEDQMARIDYFKAAGHLGMPKKKVIENGE